MTTKELTFLAHPDLIDAFEVVNRRTLLLSCHSLRTFLQDQLEHPQSLHYQCQDYDLQVLAIHLLLLRCSH